MLFVILTIAQGVLSFVQSVENRKLTELVTFDLRVELFKKLQELPLTFLYKQGAGRLMARATGDIESMKRFFRFTFSSFLGSFLLLIFSIAAMLTMSIDLTLLSVAMLSPLPIIMSKYGKKLRYYFQESREEYAKMTTVLQETLVSMIPIRAVGAIKHMFNRFCEHNTAYSDSLIEAGKLRATLWSTFNLIVNLTTLVIFWYGGFKIISGELEVGDIAAFTMYVGMITWPITSLGFLLINIERARVAASRVFEILDAKSEVEEDPNAKPLVVKEGRVEFRNVWFSYDGKKWILKGLNLEIEPGEFVAITGPPGSGKSTLAMLLIRLMDPQKGSILIDGQDIRKVTLSSLRSQVTIVHQDIYLFPDTIRNNIAYAKPEAPMEEIVKVARLAHIHDFIAGLPKGYDTLVGERGVTLSGGQRQRMALARALLVNPKIVVLDDTTSEIDAETERAIYEALTCHLKGKTIIAITQRPSTMALADRVIYLEDGRVKYERRKVKEVVM